KTRRRNESFSTRHSEESTKKMKKQSLSLPNSFY
ncbi:MAG: hypothetical protein ACI9QR_002396, partial [Flavobacteriaceae bacterium]